MIRGLGTCELETHRLLLRRFCQGDAQDVFARWASDPDATRYCSWHAHRDAAETRAAIERWCGAYRNPRYFHWAVVCRESGLHSGFLSVLGVNVKMAAGEAAFCIAKDCRGKGLMTEALEAVLAFCFTQAGFSRVTAKHAVDNPASGRVLRKCGMTFVSRGGESLRSKGLELTCDRYAVTREQWLAVGGKQI